MGVLFYIILSFFERMDQKEMTALNSEAVQNNTINRYLTQVNNILYAGAANSIFNGQQAEAWIFRDDIGAPHGVKGYEEQVNSVGLHHGHSHWPHHITWNTYNSATLRRGYKVFSRSCPGFTPLIRSTDPITSKNGITDRESSMTACGPHIRLSMRLRELTWVSGPQSCPRFPCTLPVS